MTKLEELKKYFLRDRYVALSEIKIVEATSALAVCEVKVKDFHLNAADLAQGGLIYTLADFTFAVLANNLHPTTVTQSANITYLSPARTDQTLKATAREITRVNKNCVCEVIVTDENGKTIAVMQVNGFIKENSPI